MGELELRPATGLSDGELATLLNAAYEGYVVPFHVDAAGVRALWSTCDLDANASRVALRDETQVGLAQLGLRGAEAWIGGVGVIPAERHRGTGRALMEAVHEEARARGVERVWLEVIVENVPAAALYERLGYVRMRELEVWTLAAEVQAGNALEVDAAVAHAWIRDHRADREPWQRADASLAHLTGLRGLVAEGGAAVVRVDANRVGVVQLAAEEAAVETLLCSARSLGESLTVLNLPAGHAAGAVLASLGAMVAVRQHEMLLEL